MPAMTALIVDDDAFARTLLRRHLSNIGFRCLEADCGRAALDALERDADRIDVILLDRRLPDMSGLDVMAALNANAEHGYIPVIMQTAADRLEDVHSGLAAGIIAYLTKPIDAEQLRALSVTAARMRERFRMLQREVASREGGMLHLDRGEFSVRTPDEARAIAVSLGIAAQAPERNVSFGLLELLLNAIEHGNLAIGGDRKQELLEEGALGEEITSRLGSPPWAGRFVSIQYERHLDWAEIRIVDQGDGFDWRAYTDVDLDRALGARGRGIAMARALAFDELSYEGSGNIAVARVRLG